MLAKQINVYYGSYKKIIKMLVILECFSKRLSLLWLWFYNQSWILHLKSVRPKCKYIEFLAIRDFLSLQAYLILFPTNINLIFYNFDLDLGSYSLYLVCIFGISTIWSLSLSRGLLLDFNTESWPMLCW